MFKILKIAIPVLLLFFLLVWERVHLVKLNLRIEDLNRQRACLLTQVHSLEVKVESLESYSRIEKLARSELNMYYPDSKDIIYIRKEKRK